VFWLGFEEDDNAWEPLLQIYEDLPAEVTSFLANFHVGLLATRALSVLSELLPLLRRRGVLLLCSMSKHPETYNHAYSLHKL
jgi:hypothetical protein